MTPKAEALAPKAQDKCLNSATTSGSKRSSRSASCMYGRGCSVHQKTNYAKDRGVCERVNDATPEHNTAYAGRGGAVTIATRSSDLSWPTLPDSCTECATSCPHPSTTLPKADALVAGLQRAPCIDDPHLITTPDKELCRRTAGLPVAAETPFQGRQTSDLRGLDRLQLHRLLRVRSQEFLAEEEALRDPFSPLPRTKRTPAAMEDVSARVAQPSPW